EGASLLLASRNMEELERNASDLSIRYDLEVESRYFDACDIAAHRGFYDTLPFKPDGVVLAFGYLGDQQKAEESPEELERIIKTNYLGAASILEIVASDFENRPPEYGRRFIIGLSSVAGERGRRGNYIYGSSKAGLTALLSGLRQRLAATNTHVVTVKPGYVDTAMTRGKELPSLLLLTPDQVAEKAYRAYKKGREITYVTWYWRAMLSIVKMIPEPLFKKLKL
ncbi:MAG: SDR family NAD(P)-dependent oxidoreductase, partial [Balneolaceae bacterium]|nr:SDR family NAD(P)-dependent oxidoreductase [Balneolaceae bacterium]